VLAEVKKVEEDATITETERTAITKARVGQGKFRKDLISYWHGCSISAFPRYEILIASHIRPWEKANNFQRLDVFNGLLLLPNYDKLFDKGYVSFGDDGKIIYSPYLPESDRALLGMDDSIHLLWLDDKHREYLAYHRANCLMQG
jgi:Predicted restriction endonuclease